MSTPPNNKKSPPATKRTRWLLGLEPIFEGGWLHRGKRARLWDVEGRLVAIAAFGDVTIDLAQARTLPDEIAINAYAGLRDVDVLVGRNTHVELSGRSNNGHLRNDVPAVPEERRVHVVYVQGHTALGDVSVRVAADELH
jgi:hypothetical protein